jgi:hypothetical protein
MIPEIIATCVCVTAMAVLVPFFLKAAWPEKNKLSLLLKMICSTLFVAIALLQMRIAGNYGDFARRMLWGFVLSWGGDLFLHLPFKPRKLWYPIGVLSFFSAHIAFVSAYTAAGGKLLGVSFFTPLEIAVFVPPMIFMLCFLIYKSKEHSAKVLPFLLVYAGAVLLMMIKAAGLGIRLFIDGQQSLLVVFLLAVGGLFFLTSDFLLLLIDFGDAPGKPVRFKTFRVKSINIWTYFAAQCLLGFSILFIKA